VNPVVYVVFAMFGTFIFLIIAGGFLYFVIELMKTVRAATKAIEMIGPLLKGEELVRLTNAFILMGKQGASMLQKMEALDTTISLFYKFAVAKGEVDAMARVPSASDVTESGGGRFVQYNEEKAAAREAATAAQESTG
jgi:type II secretory pathway component PulF